jgi:hypothetical protein
MYGLITITMKKEEKTRCIIVNRITAGRTAKKMMLFGKIKESTAYIMKRKCNAYVAARAPLMFLRQPGKFTKGPVLSGRCAPAHKIRRIQDWCEDTLSGFPEKNIWLPNSPACNPLDHIVWRVTQPHVNKTPQRISASLMQKIRGGGQP